MKRNGTLIIKFKTSVRLIEVLYDTVSVIMDCIS